MAYSAEPKRKVIAALQRGAVTGDRMGECTRKLLVKMHMEVTPENGVWLANNLTRWERNDPQFVIERRGRTFTRIALRAEEVEVPVVATPPVAVASTALPAPPEDAEYEGKSLFDLFEDLLDAVKQITPLTPDNEVTLVRLDRYRNDAQRLREKVAALEDARRSLTRERDELINRVHQAERNLKRMMDPNNRVSDRGYKAAERFISKSPESQKEGRTI